MYLKMKQPSDSTIINNRLLQLNSFFDDKNFYESMVNLIETRSKVSSNRNEIIKLNSNPNNNDNNNDNSNDIWNYKPVDFTMKLYHPKPPLRNSKESMKPWLYQTEYEKNKEPKVNEELKEEKEEEERGKRLAVNNFNATFRLITPSKARALAAKTKLVKEIPYKNPKPHDFRGVCHLN
jgi:hypothetical protein